MRRPRLEISSRSEVFAEISLPPESEPPQIFISDKDGNTVELGPNLIGECERLFTFFGKALAFFEAYEKRAKKARKK